MLSISNLNFRHSQSHDDLFRSFCLSFGAGITALIGKNGVGKSSLFDIITDSYLEFIKHKETANVIFDLNANLEIVHQKPDLSLLEWYSPLELVNILSKIKKQKMDLERFESNLHSFKINPKAKISSLSGGQKQIVNIIKALALEPNLILLDEPFGALDIENSVRLKAILQTWQNQNKATVIMISHSIDDILTLADRVVILGNKPVEVVFDLGKNQIDEHGRLIISEHFQI